MVEALAHILPSSGLYNQAATIGHGITDVIRKASQRVGVDFSYMLAKAQQESGLDPTAKAATSSATGLYQFTNQTWLRMVKAHGDDYGLQALASKITIADNGVAHVTDAESRQKILALRNDPALSAVMAAEFTQENKAALQENVGGKIGATELYLAHFLGSGGASQFLNALHSDPTAKAAAILPEAAASNRSVFYGHDGQPKSVAQIYARFAEKFNNVTESAPTQSRTQLAANILTSPVHSVSSSSTDVATNAYMTALGRAGQGDTTYSLPSSGAGSIGHAGLNNFKMDGNGASAFAAMVLAQMDMGQLSPASLLRMNETQRQESEKSSSNKGKLAGSSFA